MRVHRRVRTALFVAFVHGLVTAALGQVASANPCAVRAQSASVDNVSIQPAGEAAFGFSLEHLPMEARLSGTNAAELEVMAPLRFTTSHSWNNLGVMLSARVSLMDGRLIIPAGAYVNVAAQNHDTKNEDLPALLHLRELRTRAPVPIPCAKLTLPGNTPLSRTRPAHVLPKTQIVFARTDNEFALYATTKEVAPWHIKFDGPLKVVKRSGSWLRVEAKWDDGTRLRGWAKSELFLVTRAVPVGVGGEMGAIGMGLCGSSHRRAPIPFILKANAPIHSGPKGAIWAHTAGSIKVEAFSLSRSDGWMQIVGVDGFPKRGCSDHNKIWVHASSVQWTDTPLE